MIVTHDGAGAARHDRRNDVVDLWPRSCRPTPHTANQFLKLYVFVLAAFVGYQVISRVPPLLHTPLMSATNAITAISLVGSLVAAGRDNNTVSTMLGFIAVTAR